MPSAEINLDTRYGPEHAPVTHAEKAQAESLRRLLLSNAVTSLAARALGRSLLETTEAFVNDTEDAAVRTASPEDVEAEAWFEGFTPTDVGKIYSSQSLFTIYVHHTPGHKHNRPSIFTGREITELVDTSNAYGQHTLIKAERELLRAALKDANNVKFVLVSHDAVPLHPPHVFWAQLMAEGPTSRVGFLPVASNDKGWLPQMETAHSKSEHFRTGSQWFVLIRAHAMLIERDTHMEYIFDKLCGHGNQNCVSDEMDGCGCSTHVAFTMGNWSPHSYTASEVNNSLIQYMRRGYDSNCPWEGMLSSARTTFTLWADGGQPDQARSAKLDALPTYEAGPLDELAKYVQASGYVPSSSHCPLLGRKFAGERKGILLKTMMDCDGGGLASHCL